MFFKHTKKILVDEIIVVRQFAVMEDFGQLINFCNKQKISALEMKFIIKGVFTWEDANSKQDAVRVARRINEVREVIRR